ncbi:MAG: hypothetical protein ACR2J8_00535, partial [Thermomicrobiales bacterium]
MAQAVTAATAGDVITVAPGLYVEDATGISKNLTIRACVAGGGNAGNVTIQALGVSPTSTAVLYQVTGGAKVAFENVTVKV